MVKKSEKKGKKKVGTFKVICHDVHMKGGERFPPTTNGDTAMMMTGHELFCKAHAIARETRSAYITYRAAFSAALKGMSYVNVETGDCAEG